MCLEMPVPWKQILTYDEITFLKHHLCDSIELEMCSVFNKHLQPDFSSLTSRWSLHCHCHDSTSLQCLAGRKLIASLFEELLTGTVFNQMFWFYRQYVNRGMPEGILYMGSTYFRKLHLIYIRVILDADMKKVRKLNFGSCVYIDGYYGNFLVVFCRSCNLTEIQARVCARRTRKMIKKAIHCCSGPKHSSKREILRQRELERLMKYGVPISQKYVKYL